MWNGGKKLYEINYNETYSFDKEQRKIIWNTMAAKVEKAAGAKEKMLYNFNNLMSQICV